MWQFSEVVDGMSEACRALGIPVVGGNVSFYNESRGARHRPHAGGRRGRPDRRARRRCRPAPGCATATRSCCSARPRPSSAVRSGRRCTASRRHAAGRRPRRRRRAARASSPGWSSTRDGRRRARLLRRRARGRAGRDGDRRAGAGSRSRSAELVPSLAWFSESASRVVRRGRPRPAPTSWSSGPAPPASRRQRLGAAGGDRLVRRRRLRRRPRRRHPRLARRPPDRPRPTRRSTAR